MLKISDVIEFTIVCAFLFLEKKMIFWIFCIIYRTLRAILRVSIHEVTLWLLPKCLNHKVACLVLLWLIQLSMGPTVIYIISESTNCFHTLVKSIRYSTINFWALPFKHGRKRYIILQAFLTKTFIKWFSGNQSSKKWFY